MVRKEELTDTHGTKMATEYGFPECLDVWDPFVEGSNDQ
jgi:hypothetical protein